MSKEIGQRLPQPDASKNDDIARQLDEIIRLLQELLIIQGLKMNISIEAIRALVRVDKNRVNRLSKFRSP